MKFCVIRHPDVTALGTCAETALEQHQAQGWFRVSDWRGEPGDFYLPDFADATADLDAHVEAETPDDPQDEPTPARSSKKEKQA